MRILNQQNFKNQRAIVRVDFNVPLNEKFEVTDRTRIEAAKSTIDYILNKGGSCVLLSHLGRPDGCDPKLSLSHIVKTVAEVLDRPVKFCSTSVGTEAEASSNGLDQGEVLLMENLRFHKEERDYFYLLDINNDYYILNWLLERYYYFLPWLGPVVHRYLR